MTQFWQLCCNDPVAIILIGKERWDMEKACCRAEKKPNPKPKKQKASEKCRLMPAVPRELAWERGGELLGRPAREAAWYEISALENYARFRIPLYNVWITLVLNIQIPEQKLISDCSSLILITFGPKGTVWKTGATQDLWSENTHRW